MEPFAMCDTSGGTQGLARDYEQHLGAAGRALIQACVDCTHVQFPPTLLCPRCWSSALAWVDGGATGHISTFVTVHAEEITPSYSVPGRLSSRTPYTTVFVELDDHHGVRVPALLAQIDSPPGSGSSRTVSLSVSPQPRPYITAATT